MWSQGSAAEAAGAAGVEALAAAAVAGVEAQAAAAAIAGGEAGPPSNATRARTAAWTPSWPKTRRPSICVITPPAMMKSLAIFTRWAPRSPCASQCAWLFLRSPWPGWQ